MCRSAQSECTNGDSSLLHSFCYTDEHMDGWLYSRCLIALLCLCRDEMAMVLVNTQVHYLVFTAVDNYAKYFLTIQWSDSGSVDDTQQLE